MKKKFLVVASFLLWIGGTALAQTVDEVVEKHVQAMGGTDKLNNLKAVKISSTMQVMGTDVTQTTTAVHQKAFRQDINAQGMTMVQVIEGESGWGSNPLAGQPEPTPLPAEMVKMMADQLDLTGSLYKYKEKGSAVELIGKENVGTTEAFKLKVTKKNGTVEHHFVDAKSYLPVKTTLSATVQGQNFKQEMLNSNFKQIDGLTFPFKVEMKSDAIPGGAPIVVNITTVEVNPTVDEAIFKMPAKKQ